MSDIQTLLHRADAYMKRAKAAPSTVSRKLFGNGNRLAEIKAGGTLTIRKLEEALATMDELESSSQGVV